MNVRNFLIGAVVCMVFSPLCDAQEARSQRQTFKLPEMAALNLPFSDAVLVGNTLYLSGNGGLDLTTMSAPEDPGDETRALMENFIKTLAMADMTLEDLVTVTVYCSDLSLYSAFNEVYASYFTDEFPARAFIGSGPLLFGMRFEMQAIAVK
jgi:2-iminobutanoate/2-iminopropanoate deaminase